MSKISEYRCTQKSFIHFDIILIKLVLTVCKHFINEYRLLPR